MFVFLRQVAAWRRLWGAINPRVATVRFISFSLATKNISTIVRETEREGRERQGDVEVEQHFSHSCARSIFVTLNGIELKLLPWR